MIWCPAVRFTVIVLKIMFRQWYDVHVEKKKFDFIDCLFILDWSCFFLTFSRRHCRTVALIKSDKDNRYGLDSVVTHDGTKMACWALSELSSFHDKLGIEAYDKVGSNTLPLNLHAYVVYLPWTVLPCIYFEQFRLVLQAVFYSVSHFL